MLGVNEITISVKLNTVLRRLLEFKRVKLFTRVKLEMFTSNSLLWYVLFLFE